MQKCLYYISYDLRNQKDYKKLYHELAKFKAIKILESLYCFKYQDNKTLYLRDHFKKFIDNDDRLLVIKSENWASFRIVGDPNEL
jgi:hypothetical protein